jgi:Glycosyltransferase 61
MKLEALASNDRPSRAGNPGNVGLIKSSFYPEFITGSGLRPGTDGRSDQGMAPAAHDKSAFIARPSSRHRRIVNAEEVESRPAAPGFATFLPEQHPFAAQMRQVRESRNVVVQNASAAHALLLARPGTRGRIRGFRSCRSSPRCCARSASSFRSSAALSCIGHSPMSINRTIGSNRNGSTGCCRAGVSARGKCTFERLGPTRHSR